MAATSVPVGRVAMRSSDPGEVEALMSQRYVEHCSRVVGDAAGFVFRSESAGIPPLLLDAVVEATAIAALSAFPNSTMALGRTAGPGRAGPGRAAPAAVRRAGAYMDTHAADPITLHDIARTAGLSARALQAGFRRHFDTTPTGYLLTVRLERAHRDLQNADPTTGATVAGIARRWASPTTAASPPPTAPPTASHPAGRCVRDYHRTNSGTIATRSR